MIFLSASDVTADLNTSWMTRRALAHSAPACRRASSLFGPWSPKSAMFSRIGCIVKGTENNTVTLLWYNPFDPTDFHTYAVFPHDLKKNPQNFKENFKIQRYPYSYLFIKTTWFLLYGFSLVLIWYIGPLWAVLSFQWVLIWKNVDFLFFRIGVHRVPYLIRNQGYFWW